MSQKTKVIIGQKDTSLMGLAKGNPGALTFLLEILNGPIESNIKGLTILPKIIECSITGADLYVLWSDLCSKDISSVEKLCRDVPNDILIDACSRQDYSGRELIKEYLN